MWRRPVGVDRDKVGSRSLSVSEEAMWPQSHIPEILDIGVGEESKAD